MKENGMNKLIELLNEYERSKGTNLEITNWKCVYGNLSYFGYGNGYSEFLCISKRYEFIQRLVENDKVDTTNKFTIMTNVENKENGLGYSHTFEGYEALIMLLSIQENPIEFLCSVLK